MTSSIFSVWLTLSSCVTRRICAYTVPINSRIALRAYSDSRLPCENSFTVVMLLYASVTRPVISERASACASAVLLSFGTKKRIPKPKVTIHRANGTSSQLSKLAKITPIVRKYTKTYTSISAQIMMVSRTASEVCITLAETRPANSS